MKTTSRIGYRMQDGGILSIYHNEGSPDWLLNILNTHYTDLETVAELIVGGDVSSCWVDDGPNHYESRPPVYDTNICFFTLLLSNINIFSLSNMVDCAVENNVAKFICASFKDIILSTIVIPLPALKFMETILPLVIVIPVAPVKFTSNLLWVELKSNPVPASPDVSISVINNV